MEEAVVGVEGYGMTDKIDSVFFQSKFLEHFFAWSIHLYSLVSFWFSFLEVLDSL